MLNILNCVLSLNVYHKLCKNDEEEFGKEQPFI